MCCVHVQLRGHMCWGFFGQDLSTNPLQLYFTCHTIRARRSLVVALAVNKIEAIPPTCKTGRCTCSSLGLEFSNFLCPSLIRDAMSGQRQEDLVAQQICESCSFRVWTASNWTEDKAQRLLLGTDNFSHCISEDPQQESSTLGTA